MKKYLFLIIFTLFKITAIGQTFTNSTTLRMEGVGQERVVPDVCMLSIQIEKFNSEFNRAVIELDKASKEIISSLIQIGFKKNQIKSTEYKVLSENVIRKERKENTDYKASHGIQVHFKYNSSTVEKLINMFKDIENAYNFSLNYYLSDSLSELVNDRLIGMAIADSHKKAGLTAIATQNKISRVRSIHYSEVYSLYSYGFSSVCGMQVWNDSHLLQNGFVPSEIVLTKKVELIYDLVGI
ncbi:MAG: SIMPL domain-containing protein [Saprospiraceae bacterium]|nr:SIMPL domain-containing protein [Saprospiraceae bacterium]